MALVMVILFSLVFAAGHLVLSHDPIREALIEKMGEMIFRGVYSLVSLVGLVGAFFFFIKYRDSMGARMWEIEPWGLPLVYLLMLCAFLLLMLSLGNPSPTGMMPTSMEPRGVLRITRHPMNMAFAMFGLAHVIANPRLGDLFLFGSFFVVGFFGAYHQDSRKKRKLGPEFTEFQNKTSVLPFAAVISGKTPLNPGELSTVLLAIGAVAFVVMLFVHSRLFGVTPY